MKSEVVVAILAGGHGARFWPMSRMARPKQFLSINQNGESLLQATARRVESITDRTRLLVVTNTMHETLIREHVPYADVLCEPIGRNTAASIGLAALRISQSNPRAVMVVLPSDHAVQDEDRLVQILKEAVALAQAEDLLVTIGVKPTSPHTGYGYIRRGPALKGRGYMVNRFYEKPNLERAKRYCDSPEFLWNSGMFVWRADVILEAFHEEMPELAAGLETIRPALGKPNEQAVIRDVFERLESVSIDFGVLERARNCAVIAAEELGWSDVGSWDAWANNFTKDAQGNLMRGDVIALEATGCLIHSERRLAAVVGLTDIIVIDSGDALLVCHRDKVQDVRLVVEELKARGRTDLI